MRYIPKLVPYHIVWRLIGFELSRLHQNVEIRKTFSLEVWVVNFIDFFNNKC